jgi:hypothetical protein
MKAPTVRIEMHVSPAISGGARVEERLVRRSGTWTVNLDAAYREMCRQAELRFGNGGALVRLFVGDHEEMAAPVVGESL